MSCTWLKWGVLYSVLKTLYIQKVIYNLFTALVAANLFVSEALLRKLGKFSRKFKETWWMCMKNFRDNFALSLCLLDSSWKFSQQGPCSGSCSANLLSYKLNFLNVNGKVTLIHGCIMNNLIRVLYIYAKNHVSPSILLVWNEIGSYNLPSRSLQTWTPLLLLH
jgi:hypothetical protein